MSDIPLDLSMRVHHKHFGDGVIDQCRERSGQLQYHVYYPERETAGWFIAKDLAPIKAEPTTARAEAAQ